MALHSPRSGKSSTRASSSRVECGRACSYRILAASHRSPQHRIKRPCGVICGEIPPQKAAGLTLVSRETRTRATTHGGLTHHKPHHNWPTHKGQEHCLRHRQLRPLYPLVNPLWRICNLPLCTYIDGAGAAVGVPGHYNSPVHAINLTEQGSRTMYVGNPAEVSQEQPGIGRDSRSNWGRVERHNGLKTASSTNHGNHGQ